MHSRMTWLLMVLAAFVPMCSIAGPAKSQSDLRLANKCSLILAEGAIVVPGRLSQDNLHFYPTWNFQVPEVDKGKQLKAGERIWVTDKSTNGVSCVATQWRAGWVPSSQVLKSPHESFHPSGPDKLIGTWKRDKTATLVIIGTHEGGLSIKNATETCPGVCNHNAYAKNMAGTPADHGIWVFKEAISPGMLAQDPDHRPKPCQINVRRIGQALYVLDRDGGVCGGLNGSFRGTYHKVKG